MLIFTNFSYDEFSANLRLLSVFIRVRVFDLSPYRSYVCLHRTAYHTLVSRITTHHLRALTC